MAFRSSGIRARLIILVICVALPPLVALALGFILQVQHDTHAARDLAHRIARSIATDQRDSVVRSREFLDRLARRPGITAATASDCDPLFRAVDFFPQYIALQLFDARGSQVCGSIPEAAVAGDAAAARQAAVQLLRSGQALPVDPYLFSIGDRWISLMFRGVGNAQVRNGTLVLVQYVDFNLDAYPAGTLLTIVDRSSRVVARSSDPEKWAGRHVFAQVVRTVLQRGDGTIEATGIDGQLREYGFTRVGDTGWYLYIGIPARVAMAAVRALVVRGLMVGLLLIAFVVLVAIRFSQEIERPLDRLARMARRVTAEGYGAALPVDGPREIATVAEAFNTMVARRGEAEAALEASRGQLQELSKRLLEAQEEERRRIGREIHDELGQLLTALNMDVGGLIEAAGPLPQSKQGMAERIRRVLSETLTSVQRISSELRPPMLDDFGLLAAIESYVRGFEERTGIECELSLPQELPVIGHEAETAIYRILQESMTNIARHADAVRSEIRVRVRPEALFVEVRDDGRGIRAEEVRSRAAIGITGMRERASRVGATLEIEGIPQHGTIVSVRLPLNHKEGSTA